MQIVQVRALLLRYKKFQGVFLSGYGYRISAYPLSSRKYLEGGLVGAETMGWIWAPLLGEKMEGGWIAPHPLSVPNSPGRDGTPPPGAALRWLVRQVHPLDRGTYLPVGGICLEPIYACAIPERGISSWCPARHYAPQLEAESAKTTGNCIRFMSRNGRNLHYKRITAISKH
jgi:hypothetical protein